MENFSTSQRNMSMRRRVKYLPRQILAGDLLCRRLRWEREIALQAIERHKTASALRHKSRQKSVNSWTIIITLHKHGGSNYSNPCRRYVQMLSLKLKKTVRLALKCAAHQKTRCNNCTGPCLVTRRGVEDSNCAQRPNGEVVYWSGDRMMCTELL